MNKLELTEKHKSKILEMCRILFPKYKDWKFGSVKCNGHMELWFYDNKNNSCEIHWFEFCLNQLPIKLFEKIQINRHSYFIELYNSINNSIEESKFKHPIDYLYEQFKKVKS